MTNRVKTIINFMDQEYPFRKAEKWDKVGHSFGDINQPVTGVVVALDLTTAVFDQAVRTNSQLIITHHPFIFNDDINQDFLEAPYKKALVDRIKNTGMALLALHTNYDVAKKGMNKVISSMLGIKTLRHSGKYGVMIDQAMPSHDIELLMTKTFNLPTINKNFSDSKVFKKWAILPGSGSNEAMLQMKKDGADLIITSDIKWSQWLTAKEMNIDLMEISHYIENIFTEDVAKTIKNNFKKIEVTKVMIN